MIGDPTSRPKAEHLGKLNQVAHSSMKQKQVNISFVISRIDIHAVVEKTDRTAHAQTLDHEDVKCQAGDIARIAKGSTAPPEANPRLTHFSIIPRTRVFNGQMRKMNPEQPVRREDHV